MNKNLRDAKTRLRIHIAAALAYGSYRLLGATKQHAWDKARLFVVNGIIDKTLEKTGIRDPRMEPGMDQATFEGGPNNREVRAVAKGIQQVVFQPTGPIVLGVGRYDAPSPPDHRLHRYRRTSLLRGQSVVFTYEGFN